MSNIYCGGVTEWRPIVVAINNEVDCELGESDNWHMGELGSNVASVGLHLVTGLHMQEQQDQTSDGASGSRNRLMVGLAGIAMSGLASLVLGQQLMDLRRTHGLVKLIDEFRATTSSFQCSQCEKVEPVLDLAKRHFSEARYSAITNGALAVGVVAGSALAVTGAYFAVQGLMIGGAVLGGVALLGGVGKTVYDAARASKVEERAQMISRLCKELLSEQSGEDRNNVELVWNDDNRAWTRVVREYQQTYRPQGTSVTPRNGR